jgi:hypothetical protein
MMPDKRTASHDLSLLLRNLRRLLLVRREMNDIDQVEARHERHQGRVLGRSSSSAPAAWHIRPYWAREQQPRADGHDLLAAALADQGRNPARSGPGIPRSLQ